MTQLFKQDYGNLVCVESHDNEAELRSAGFKTLDELFGNPSLDAVAKEQKVREQTQRKGRKA